METRCFPLGAYSERHTPLLIEEKAPIPNIDVVLERTKIWSGVRTGPETKNTYAGEDQQ
jgi:hypothetical protein